MEYSKVEKVILERFEEKCRIAGGPRAGYMLRRKAISASDRGSSELDFTAGLEGLVQKGILQPNEGGDLFYLTERGVAALQEI